MKPLSRQDPVFGKIRYIQVADPSKNYWEGMGSISNKGTIVELLIDGDESGPEEIQRNFFLKMRGRFAEVLASSKPLLSMAYFGENNRQLASNVEDDLPVGALWIPRMESIPPKRWELCFKTAEERCYWLTFEGWDPKNIRLQ